MNENEKLQALKIDLGIVSDAYDNRLRQYLETALAEITREGIKDDDSVAFSSWVVAYAAWMWRKRDSGEGMPRMLRYALNNMLFEQHLED